VRAVELSAAAECRRGQIKPSSHRRQPEVVRRCFRDVRAQALVRPIWGCRPGELISAHTTCPEIQRRDRGDGAG
jgi:hypothetical protein